MRGGFAHHRHGKFRKVCSLFRKSFADAGILATSGGNFTRSREYARDENHKPRS